MGCDPRKGGGRYTVGGFLARHNNFISLLENALVDELFTREPVPVAPLSLSSPCGIIAPWGEENATPDGDPENQTLPAP